MNLLIGELLSQPVWISQGRFDNVLPPLPRIPPWTRSRRRVQGQ